MLLYDQYGLPLAGLGGGGLMRDHGYIGSRNQSRFGINIEDIEDPALRQLLNALRQSFGDPTRMVIEAAGIYFENIERVNAEVQASVRRSFRSSRTWWCPSSASSPGTRSPAS